MAAASQRSRTDLKREQGTVKPPLTTPLRREELLLGKALGVVVPAVGMADVLFDVIQACARLFASNAAVVSALGQGPHILTEIRKWVSAAQAWAVDVHAPPTGHHEAAEGTA